MKSLRILLVMLEPPLPFGSAAARIYYALIKGLIERGHRVTAFATCSRPEEVAKAESMFPSPAYDLRCFPHPTRSGLRAKWQTLRRPYSYMFANSLRTALARELEAGYDILHLEQLLSGWLALDMIERSLVSVHYLSSIDLQDARPGSLSARTHRLMMLRTERRLLNRFRFFRAVSSRIAEGIKQTNGSADATPVTVGFDTSLYRYIPADHRGGAPIVTLIGSMNWQPTYTAAIRMLTRLYPRIKHQVPDSRFRIVGWGARHALRDYLRMPDVEVMENVPDVAPFFESAAVMLYAPESGSGVKVKVLEAMAYGVPVVTTSQGIEGLPATDGVQASVADDDEGLVERTAALLKDRRAQNQQRSAARELLETVCRPSLAVQAIEPIYHRMLNQCGGSPS